MENLNRPITSNETESVIQKKKKKIRGPDSLTGDFYQTFKELKN